MNINALFGCFSSRHKFLDLQLQFLITFVIGLISNDFFLNRSGYYRRRKDSA